jgi:hypothetical protein
MPDEPSVTHKAALAKPPTEHEKTADGLHQGGSVFADSAPVSNGSEDEASPGC